MKTGIIVFLLAMVVFNVAQAQRYFPDGITLSNEFVRQQGLVDVSSWNGGAVTGALVRGLGVSVGQLCGIDPITGVVIVDTNNLLPLVARSVSGDGSALTDLNAAHLSGTVDNARLAISLQTLALNDGGSLTNLNPQNLMNGDITVSNVVFSKPRWIDMLVSGTAVGRPSSGAPALQNVGDGIFGMGYGHGDHIYFSIQGPHKFANTNAQLPDFYYEPHIHVSTIQPPSVGVSNATFTLTYQVAIGGQPFTNVVSLTNSIGFAATNNHRMLSFGNVINNGLAGRSSVIFRGVLTRIPSAADDIGTAQNVIVDSLDFHVPITEIGSAAQFGD